MSKKIVCSGLTGKIYYADVKNGVMSNKKEVNELDFLTAVVEKVMYENNKIELETKDKKYTLKLEIEDK